MRAALIIAVIASGCIRAAAFECTSDPQCIRAGMQGTCESVGFCSFPDGSCTSGRRFGDASGTYTQQCVGNASVDAGIPGCPVGYATLTGVPNHVYRRIGTSSAWQDQMMACDAEGANVYLAVPGDDAELQAILTLAGANVWVGVDDLATENSFVTVRGSAATFLPWVPGQPDNTGDSDCVMALMGSPATYDDKRCTTTGAIAVCECEP